MTISDDLRAQAEWLNELADELDPPALPDFDPAFWKPVTAESIRDSMAMWDDIYRKAVG